jgi:hypothetical protein
MVSFHEPAALGIRIGMPLIKKRDFNGELAKKVASPLAAGRVFPGCHGIIAASMPLPQRWGLLS